MKKIKDAYMFDFVVRSYITCGYIDFSYENCDEYRPLNRAKQIRKFMFKSAIEQGKLAHHMLKIDIPFN